jgi:hypothetical protein
MNYLNVNSGGGALAGGGLSTLAANVKRQMSFNPHKVGHEKKNSQGFLYEGSSASSDSEGHYNLSSVRSQDGKSREYSNENRGTQEGGEGEDQEPSP